ncbi:MAG TPA: alpha/beta fold hydrolase [Nocardioidaceae bacterium]|nr:alpha/beta fold hydrolase [Nocardioidaceae bacterium]
MAPAVGARWAERLWFTVPRDGRARSPEDGASFEIQLHGRVVRGWTWGRGPVVYLVHGWGGYAGQLAPFVQPLVAAGFTVVAHDAPSHGASDGGRHGPRAGDIIESAQSLDAVAARYGPAHAVVGHSMGAMASTLAIRHGWLGARRLVMVAPMVKIDDALAVFAARLGFGARIGRRLARRVERRVGVSLAEFDLVTMTSDPARPRLLAIHDRGDRETSFRSTDALVAGWPDAELVATKGLGHRRILRDPAVVRTVVDTLVTDTADVLSRPA